MPMRLLEAELLDSSSSAVGGGGMTRAVSRQVPGTSMVPEMSAWMFGVRVSQAPGARLPTGTVPAGNSTGAPRSMAASFNSTWVEGAGPLPWLHTSTVGTDAPGRKAGGGKPQAPWYKRLWT
ncbi:hypothetical protein [Archangium sp.]|uniref:hypothetical protein n=1 Tax=Archangium sp. TaxID=1872627 RepID=UPI002D700EC6|nr:hypothetical protein [Archangium sp.]HYO58828.1 hypothetical protein [Archangium sp.]